MGLVMAATLQAITAHSLKGFRTSKHAERVARAIHKQVLAARIAATRVIGQRP